MISPTRSAISWPAPDAPLCHVLPRVSITRYPTISPRSPTGSKSEPQTRHRCPIGSAWLSPLYRRVLHGRHLKCGIGALLVVRSRQVRVAGIAQTERARFGPGTPRSPIGQAPLSSDCGREPARAAVTIEFASPARCPVLSPRRHGLTPFHPSGASAREGRGREPPSGRSDRGAVTGPVG